MAGSDVRVYMRRGQFYDKPDLLFNHRRSGDDTDAFGSNLTEEYQQEVPPGDDSLAEHWEKDQDTRKYAEKLTKYLDSKNSFVDTEQSDKYHPQENGFNPETWETSLNELSSIKTSVDPGHHVPDLQRNIYYKLTTPPARRVSIQPNPIIPTTVIHSGSSEIVMRKFEPVSNIVPEGSDEVDEYDDQSLRVIGKETDSNTKPPEELERKTQAVPPDIRIRFEDSPKRKFVKMRHWDTSLKPLILEYTADVDEDNVVYKAV